MTFKLKYNLVTLLAITVMSFTWLSITGEALGQYFVRDMCRVKGQEENKLHGIGLVIGLPGTGDPSLQLTRDSLAQAVRKLGLNLPGDELGLSDPSLFGSVTNTAIVMVTATIPAEGAREGTMIDCEVHAFGEAKSLQGGTLLQTVLTGGPVVADAGKAPVLATAAGKIQVDESQAATTGTIRHGSKLEVEFRNDFFYFDVPRSAYQGTTPIDQVPKSEVYVDLVVDNAHASFATASDIAEFINQNVKVTGNLDLEERRADLPAVAFDQVTIQVQVPQDRRNDIVAFVGDLFSTPISSNQAENKVVIDRATGVILIGANVRFSPTAVTSGDFVIESGPFKALDLDDNLVADGDPTQKLTDLVEALNALQAPPQTIIDILTHMGTNGFLSGSIEFQ